MLENNRLRINFKIEIPRLNNQTTEDLSPDQTKKLTEVLDAEEDGIAGYSVHNRAFLYTLFAYRTDDGN